MSTLEQRTIARVSARLIPFLIACYFGAFLDRVNVSFAALTMNRDLGLTASQYGFGAGLFFITYFLFELPSNLALSRVGARRWIARIMFAWGLLSGATAFVDSASGFYLVRLLLGAAEAGFFPGIIFYLTLWFPSAYRARIIGYFMAAGPMSTVIGAPLSGLLLRLDGTMGLKGWQWLFIVEALPSLILSVVVWFYLTDRPSDAAWLKAEEREWLEARLAAEEQQRRTSGVHTLRHVLTTPKVLALCAAYFALIGTNNGVGLFLPQMVQSLGLTNLRASLVAALPFLVGGVAMVLWGRHSDRTRERRYHAAFPLLVGGLTLLTAAFVEDPVLGMAALTVTGFGMFSSMPVFWTLCTGFLTGTAAAGGIAFINSVGNLAGFVGPSVMGWARDYSGGYALGLLLLAGASFIGMSIMLTVRDDGQRVTDASYLNSD